MAEYINKKEVLSILANSDIEELDKAIINANISCLSTIDIIKCVNCKHQKKIHSTTYCSAFGGFNGTGQDYFFCRHREGEE